MRNSTKGDKFVPGERGNKVWWVVQDSIGIWEFSFDRKKIYNFYADWDRLTKKQKRFLLETSLTSQVLRAMCRKMKRAKTMTDKEATLLNAILQAESDNLSEEVLKNCLSEESLGMSARERDVTARLLAGKGLIKGVSTLDACGMVAETYTKADTPVDTGRLRNSITHKVVERDCYIGSNVEYAPYIEYGTGIYASEGNGRQGGWAYISDSGRGGFTMGSKAHHMLRNAANDHIHKYKKLIKESLKN